MGNSFWKRVLKLAESLSLEVGSQEQALIGVKKVWPHFWHLCKGASCLPLLSGHGGLSQ